MNYTINAAGKRLGRIASEAASVLRGKHTPRFTPHAPEATRVVVEGVSKLFLSEKKRHEKTYARYSGYPSGQKVESLKQLAARRGIAEVIRRAVYGMLPKNRTRARLIKNLIVRE